MQFFKEIKTKALATAFQEPKTKKQSQQNSKETTQQGRTSDNFFKDIKEKAITAAILQLGLQKKEQEKVPEAQPIDSGTLVNGRIWKTAAPSQQTVYQEATPESAANFIQNLVSSVRQFHKQQKMRPNKARAVIFSKIEAEPIYMFVDSERRILEMEMENPYCDMIDRLDMLAVDQSTVDQAIENILFTGYLWQANHLQYRNMIDGVSAILQNDAKRICSFSNQIKEYRQLIAPFLSHFHNIQALQKRQQIAMKKIKLLKKVKSYSKDIYLKIQNIDQAFYVERSKQKMYHHFVRNKELVKKVTLLQQFEKKINSANRNVLRIIQESLNKWIDEGFQMEKKHIEKLLILVYFVRTEVMYSENNFKVSFDKLNNIQFFQKELKQIAKWPDYKYVNDRGVKGRVKEFLMSLIAELSRDPNKNEKISLTLKQHNPTD